MLHDFAALLDFIAANDLVATGQHQLLPLAALPALNDRLARPLRLNLQRPVQKSFPHINGLFLLGRAAGLLRVIRQTQAAHLRLDAADFEAWQPLNPTERYFTSLEAYLLHTSPEMIGERGGWRDLPGLGHKCKMVWERIGANDIRVPKETITSTKPGCTISPCWNCSASPASKPAPCCPARAGTLPRLGKRIWSGDDDGKCTWVRTASSLQVGPGTE